MGKKNQDTKEVKVARINARQAIAISLITAVIGLVGIIASGIFEKEKTLPKIPAESPLYSPQPHLFLRGISLDDEKIDIAKVQVRVVANVNGVKYSYPVSRPWVDLQHFRDALIFLPNADRYIVSFTVQFKHPNGVDTFHGVENFPFEFPSRYFAFNEIIHYRLAAVDLSAFGHLFFTIRKLE